MIFFWFFCSSCFHTVLFPQVSKPVSRTRVWRLPFFPLGILLKDLILESSITGREAYFAWRDGRVRDGRGFFSLRRMISLAWGVILGIFFEVSVLSPLLTFFPCVLGGHLC